MKKTAALVLLLALLTGIFSAVQADLIFDFPGNLPAAPEIIPAKPTYPESEDCCSIKGCTVQDVYAETLDRYYLAVSEQWKAAELSDAGFCFMMADIYGDAPLENIGYAITDFDNDGVCELIVGVMPSVTDDFFAKMIFEMYAKDKSGKLVLVFNSWDRNRHYYAGGDRFANIGSSSAFDSVDTTKQYKDLELIDLGYATPDSEYEFPPLQPLSDWKK